MMQSTFTRAVRLPTLAAAIAPLLAGCGAFTSPTVAIPPELAQVIQGDFDVSPTTAKSAPDNPTLSLDDLAGCWGRHEFAEAEIDIGLEPYEALIVTHDEFERQMILQLNGQTVLYSKGLGHVQILKDGTLRMSYSDDVEFQFILPIDPPKNPSGVEAPYTDYEIILQDDILTFLYQYEDGSDGSFAYRRFECP